MIDSNTLPYITREQLAFERGTTFSLTAQVVATTQTVYTLRGFTKEGPFTYAIQAAGTGTNQTFTFRIPDIPIMITLLCSVVDEPRNKFLASVFLTINGEANILLCSGYPNGSNGISWPWQVIPSEPQKHGYFNQITTADPAAGADAIQALPAQRIWKLKHISFQLVSDATVANRSCRLRLTLAGGQNIYISTGKTQTASQTIGYSFYEGAARIDDTTYGLVVTPLIDDVWLPPGSTIYTATVGIQAGDLIQLLRLTYEEHIMASST